MAEGSGAAKQMEVPFSAGLAQQYHARYAPAGQAALIADNVRYTHDGVIEKRPGNTVLAKLSDPGGLPPGKLARYKSEIVAIDHAGNGFSWSPAANAMQARSTTMDCMVRRSPVAASMNVASQPSTAYGNGVRVDVWSTDPGSSAGHIFLHIVDVATGADIYKAQAITTGSALYFQPRVCFVSGSSEFIVAYRVVGNVVKALKISSAYFVGTASNLTTANHTQGDFEIAGLPDRFVFAHQDTRGTWVTVYTFSTAFATLQFADVGEPVAFDKRAFSISATSGEYIWVAYTSGVGIGQTDRVFLTCLTTSSLAQVSGFPVTVHLSATELPTNTGVVRTSSTTCLVAFGALTATAVGSSVMAVPYSTAAAPVGSATAARRKTFWCQLASYPFVGPTGRTYAWVYTGGARFAAPTGLESFDHSLVLLDLQAGDTSALNVPGRMASGAVAPRFSKPSNYINGSPPSAVARLSADLFQSIGAVERSNAGQRALAVLDADFDSPDIWQSTELGGTLLMTPGTMYDSSRFVEVGFPYYPEELKLTDGGAATGTMVAGDYYYVGCYAWIDSHGNVHRSAISFPRGITIALNHSVSIQFPCLSCTAKNSVFGSSDVALEVYRTTVGGTSAGPFYRVFSGLVGSTLTLNDPALEYKTILDTLPDATRNLASQPTVYDTGGVLEDVMPPAAQHIVTYRGRIVLVGDDGLTLYFSKAYVDGGAVAFCDEFTLAPLDENETITGLAVMDDKLVIFTRQHVFFTSFDGPPDTGGVSDIRPPLRVAVDVGCIEPRSIVVMPGGIMFQSQTGIQLLSRSMQIVTPTFGQPVQDELAAFPVITSATMHPSGGVVLFGVAESSSSDDTGKTIVYDYIMNKWSTDTCLGINGDTATQRSSAQVVDGVLYWLGNDAGVYQETADSWLDNARFVPRVYETAWVHPGGLQGFQTLVRYVFMAERFTSHALKFELFKDYSETVWETFTVAQNQIDAMVVEQWSQAVRVVRSQAIKLRITEVAPTTSLGTGRGAAWVNLAIKLDPVSDTVKLGAGSKG